MKLSIDPREESGSDSFWMGQLGGSFDPALVTHVD